MPAHLRPRWPRRRRGDAAASRATAEPGEFSGSHTTRSGMSVISSGSVIAPRGGADGDRITVGRADLGGGGGGQPRDGGPRRAREVRLAVLQPPRVEQHPPARQHGLPGRRVGSARRDGHVGRGGARCPATLPSRCELGAGGGGVAQAEVDADLLGQRGEHAHVRRWRWAAARARTAAGGPPS